MNELIYRYADALNKPYYLQTQADRNVIDGAGAIVALVFVAIVFVVGFIYESFKSKKKRNRKF